tara:strand:+ start:553 stop:732 length:180 start_codon:yes stop_codon:yes gene_type:complete
MGKVKAWLMKLEENAIDDIGNHDSIDSWLKAHPQCDEETLREYWNEFQYDKEIYYAVVE